MENQVGERASEQPNKIKKQLGHSPCKAVEAGEVIRKSFQNALLL